MKSAQTYVRGTNNDLKPVLHRLTHASNGASSICFSHLNHRLPEDHRSMDERLNLLSLPDRKNLPAPFVEYQETLVLRITLFFLFSSFSIFERGAIREKAALCIVGESLQITDLRNVVSFVLDCNPGVIESAGFTVACCITCVNSCPNNLFPLSVVGEYCPLLNTILFPEV
jgi:hypothetical protein